MHITHGEACLDWTEVGKVAAPAFVGAFSAILAAVLTNVFAERRHQREVLLKQRELEQRSLESLIPTRLSAYRAVFLALQKSKSSRSISNGEWDDLSGNLLWVDQKFAKRVVDTLGRLVKSGSLADEATVSEISVLQAEIQRLVGAAELNRLFDPARRSELWRASP